MVRTQCGQMVSIFIDLAAANVLDDSLRPAGEEQIVAEPARRIAIAFLFLQHAERDAQMRSTLTSARMISRPGGSYAPMQPSHRQYSCVPS